LKIAISADGQTVRMKKRQWSMTCPAADIPKWIKFYTDMRDRAGGRFAEFYREDLADLIKAQKRLQERAAT